MLARNFIIACWVVFAAYWIAAAASRKRTGGTPELGEPLMVSAADRVGVCAAPRRFCARSARATCRTAWSGRGHRRSRPLCRRVGPRHLGAPGDRLELERHRHAQAWTRARDRRPIPLRPASDLFGDPGDVLRHGTRGRPGRWLRGLRIVLCELLDQAATGRGVADAALSEGLCGVPHEGESPGSVRDLVPPLTKTPFGLQVRQEITEMPETDRGRKQKPRSG